ncbi:MAG: hypothetical protein ACI8TX_001035 [Hyphomicrobiaceae bacterium]|jgi:hypothetical protein
MDTRAHRDSRAPSLTHAHAASAVARALKTFQLGVAKAGDNRQGYDFLVNGSVRVAVRYAFPTSYREQTYQKKNGETSRYTYKRWTFNFHRHGKISERYCDFFVCLLVPSAPTTRNPTDVTAFVIPWEAITGLTFCSSARDSNPRPYRGRYARFGNGWHRIVEAATGGPTTVSNHLSNHPLQLQLDGRGHLTLIGATRPNPEEDEGSSSNT